jgi:hypothetical protein
MNLPEDMAVTETLYSDPQLLYVACGGAVEACVYTVQKTYCDMHLPVAANGKAQFDSREHEIQHCMGHNPDQPTTYRNN